VPSRMDREMLERVIAFHGHLCPGVTMGVRAAEIALREIGPHAADEEVVAVVETNNCAVDAIQYLTGCTMGKGNLIHLDHGKNAFTFARRSDGVAIRIVAVPRERAADPEEEAVIARAHSEGATDEDRRAFDALWRRRAMAIMEMDETDLYTVQPLPGYRIPPRARIYPSWPCDGCGEMTMSARITEVGGRRLCPACLRASGQAVYEMRPIGVVENELAPHVTPSRATSARSVIRLHDEFAEGLTGMAPVDKVDIIFCFDQAPGAGVPLLQYPRGETDRPARGVFTIRSPHRPNPIGVTAVKVLEVREGEMVVEGLDAWDGTPVLDIKPHLA
jgi:formylmethanofuran dehydrogenase subunit E